jgi:hypothetical protein
MITTVQIADLGPRAALRALRNQPDPERVAGLSYAFTAVTTPISGRLAPAPRLGRVALVASWEDEAAFDEFAEGHSLGEALAGGWEARMRPVRVFGAWPQMPGLPAKPLPVDDDEPIAVLTLGRPRLGRLLPFLRSAAAAEADATAAGAMVASTGLGRPPSVVSTFSIWRSVAAMRDYAVDVGGAHRTAMQTDRGRPFHHESAFVRLRPYASRGSWDGRDPLAGLAQAPSALNL